MNDMSVLPQAHSAITLKGEERTRCEVWTRMMRYHRPATSFNKGKTEREPRPADSAVEGRCSA